MNHTSLNSVRLCAAVAATLVLSSTFAAQAEDSSAATYKKDRAACLDGASQHERTACLREAAAALAESRRSRLQSESVSTLAVNAARRCQVHPEGEDRIACERMVRGEGSVSGTVAAGGQLKSLTTESKEKVD